MNLIYIVDPLCARSHVFSLALKSVMDSPLGHTLLEPSLMLGDTGASSSRPSGDGIVTQWTQIAAAAGMELTEAARALARRPDFSLSSDVPRRALVTVRALSPRLAWPYLQALQQACFVDGRDITRPEVAAGLGKAFGMAPAVLLQAMMAPGAARLATHDAVQVRGWPVAKTPTLLLEQGGQLHRIAEGEVAADELERRLAARLPHETAL